MLEVTQVCSVEQSVQEGEEGGGATAAAGQLQRWRTLLIGIVKMTIY